MTYHISAFVLMPFDPEFNSVFTDAIQPALAEVECVAIRADSDLDQRNIMQKIVHGIVRSDLIIADITSPNANVMYELGMAHGLDRPTAILTQDVSSAPFDLRSYSWSYPGLVDKRMLGDCRAS
ncbi:MAG: nucleoside 2-deoxyribosyltransferase, partial [Chloroflexota bacterium]|nr:nucleoside 2-deoxyribosyltransferase [Chloroflexota bacterium]